MSLYKKEHPDYLRLALDSMINQTIKPDQFVLVKDGPLSRELECAIESYDKDNSGLFTVVTLAENRGTGTALDEGLKCCKNELVARMDSDDIALLTRCERELRMFKEDPELSIVSGFVGEFESNPNKIVSVRTVPENQDDIMRRMRTRSAFNHPAVMYKKSDVIRCGGYGVMRRKQDHILFSHMLHSGCRARNIQDVILLFRANIDSIRRKKSWSNCRGYIEAQVQLLRRKECSLLDFTYVMLSQIGIFIMPTAVYRGIHGVFFREKKHL